MNLAMTDQRSRSLQVELERSNFSKLERSSIINMTTHLLWM